MAKSLQDKITETEARLAQMKARLSDTTKKDRNSELIAGGLLLEKLYIQDSLDARLDWITGAKQIFSKNERLQNRLIKMFQRLNTEYPAKKNQAEKEAKTENLSTVMAAIG